MRVTVRNLGVLKEATIDLKPLTVFVGPNNSGKSWLSYTLTGVLGPYGYREYVRDYSVKDVQGKYPFIDDAMQHLLDEGNAKIDLVQFAERYGEVYLNDLALHAKHWMRKFMGTEKASFEDLEIHLNLTDTKDYLREQILNFSLENNRSIGRGRRKPLLTALKEEGKSELYVYTSSEENVSEKLPRRAIKEFLISGVFSILHQSLYSYMYAFPVERTGLIPASITKVSKADQDVTQLDEIAQSPQKARSVPWYISSFIGMIVEMFESSQLDREEEAKDSEIIKHYTELAHILEKQILNFDVDFSTREPEPGREIFFKTETGDVLDMAVVSSMVKELTPLVLYLHYSAEPGELIVIDEPEMNLHPEAQAKIIEFLAMLVNAGLPVLMTTHSPYIIDHLSNLIKAAEYEDEDQIAIANKFFLKRKDAFISQDDVSVYLFKPPTVENILQEDGKINWSTFGDVTDQVASIHYDL